MYKRVLLKIIILETSSSISLFCYSLKSEIYITFLIGFV